jgi:hypothetical protein
LPRCQLEYGDLLRSSREQLANDLDAGYRTQFATYCIADFSLAGRDGCADPGVPARRPLWLLDCFGDTKLDR